MADGPGMASLVRYPSSIVRESDTLCCCRYFVVLARTSEAGTRAGEAFTAFIVESDTPGVTPGRKVCVWGGGGGGGGGMSVPGCVCIMHLCLSP